jgi:hypothetical protein
MSHKTVQLLIGRLLTDEEYRLRFVTDRRRFLTALRDQGLDLSQGEIEALVRTDPSLWVEVADRIDADLQRSSLRS